jgi:hypothetical protein
MPLIIDTYNVLHVTGILPAEIAGIDTRGLIELIRRSRYRSLPVTLVCDGTPAEDAPTGRVGPITIRYGGPGPTADALIASIIRRSSSPRRLIIVSSDRAVQREARRRRCDVLSSEQFLEQLAVDQEQPRPGRKAQAPGPAPRPSGCETASPAKKAPRSPAESVLPAELVEEAESILREGLPEEEPARAEDRPPPQAAPPVAERGPEPPAGRSDSPSSGDAHSPPKRPPEPLLPSSLIHEAEQIVRATSQADAEPPSSEEEEDEAPASDIDSAAAGADISGSIGLDLEMFADEPAEDVLPSDIIQQAESLWHEDAARELEEGPAEGKEDEDRDRS